MSRSLINLPMQYECRWWCQGKFETAAIESNVSWYLLRTMHLISHLMTSCGLPLNAAIFQEWLIVKVASDEITTLGTTGSYSNVYARSQTVDTSDRVRVKCQNCMIKMHPNAFVHIVHTWTKHSPRTWTCSWPFQSSPQHLQGKIKQTLTPLQKSIQGCIRLINPEENDFSESP